MKLNISVLTTLIAATPLTFALADDLPPGAHDPRPQEPRPNICDDKCDVRFMQLYNACKDTDPNCIADTRHLTCQSDFSCSMDCGYTAVGCVNPPGWTPSTPSTPNADAAAALSTSCSGTVTSVETEVVTIPRPRLTVTAPHPSSLADAEINDALADVVHPATNNGTDTTLIAPATVSLPGATTINSPSLVASPSLIWPSSSAIDTNLAGLGTTASAWSAETSSTLVHSPWSLNDSARSSVSTTIIDSIITSTALAGSGSVATVTSHVINTPEFTQSASTSATVSSTAAGAAMQTPTLALLGGLAMAALI